MTETADVIPEPAAPDVPELTGWAAPPPDARIPVDLGMGSRAPGKGPYRVIGDVDEKDRAEADVGGLARIVIGPIPAGQRWDIGRAAVSTDSAALSELRVFTVGERGEEPPDPDDLLDGSTSGNLDIADNASPWRITSGRYLLLRWTGATAGAICRAHIQGDVVTTW